MSYCFSDSADTAERRQRTRSRATTIRLWTQFLQIRNFLFVAIDPNTVVFWCLQIAWVGAVSWTGNIQRLSDHLFLFLLLQPSTMQNKPPVRCSLVLGDPWSQHVLSAGVMKHFTEAHKFYRVARKVCLLHLLNLPSTLKRSFTSFLCVFPCILYINE